MEITTISPHRGYAPAFTYIVSTSRKHTTRFPVNNFRECYASTVLTAACYWPWVHCIPAQTLVSVSTELNHNR